MVCNECLQLYSYTLEPIVGPEFWEQTAYPKPLPLAVKIPTGRPKKKRAKHNDIPQTADGTKLTRVNTMVTCTYCKGTKHNARTCAKKVIFMWHQVMIYLS